MRRLFLTIFLWFWLTLLAFFLTWMLIMAHGGFPMRGFHLVLHDFLLFLIAGGIFCYFISRHLTKPLGQLGKAAAQIADGRLNTRADPALKRRHDEIADLVG